MVEILSDLREPPVVGKFYMVPTVFYPLRGAIRHWPVIGPMHEDAQDLLFPYFHYHFDARFMSVSWIVRAGGGAFYRDPDTIIAGTILVEPTDGTLGAEMRAKYGGLPKKPTLRKVRCFRSSYGYSETARKLIAKRVGGDKLSERYGNVVEPILRSDGRKLCPHRKVDLSQFPPDENGIVKCPLHGLRVQCGEPMQRSFL